MFWLRLFCLVWKSNFCLQKREDNNASKTAFMNAYMRGYHALHDNPKIFDDALSYSLVPKQVKEAIEQYLAAASARMAPEEARSCTDTPPPCCWEFLLLLLED
jgi:O-methyltransferase involved in polyketide biosynthesis